MDTSKLTRKPEMVHAILKELPDKKIIVTEECKVHFPVRFEETSLANIGNVVSTVGYFAIIVNESFYGIVNIPAVLKLDPSFINKIKINDDSYYEMSFEKGSTLIDSSDLVLDNILTYYIYNEIIAGGCVPWYMNYSDLVKLFDEAPKFAGISVGNNLAIMDMVACNSCRNSKDLTRYYRHDYVSLIQEKTNPPEILPLRNISYGATNTTSKLLGSYFTDATTSALINPSVRMEGIEEKLLR